MASRLTMRAEVTRAGLAVLGIGVALLAAPSALADPETPPADPPPPLAAVVPAPVLQVDAAAAPLAIAASAPAAEGVPHLPTPDNLPPGTTTAPTEGRNLGYIRDLWHAVRTQDVTMTDALLLFAQRPMSANAPLNQMSPHNAPLPGDVLPAADAPVPTDGPAAPTAEAPLLPQMPAVPAS